MEIKRARPIQSPGVSNFSELNDVLLTDPQHGAVLYYDSAKWVNLQPGQPGQHLETQGEGASPAWVPMIDYIAPSVTSEQVIVELTTPGAGSWQAPTGVTEAIIECWGAGGGGGGWNGDWDFPEGDSNGGGGGGYARKLLTLTPLSSYNYSIGAGGAGGLYVSNGNPTWFNSPGVLSAAGAVGGTGGSANIGTVTHNGGNGGLWHETTPETGVGGGGGGGAGNNQAGYNAVLDIGGAGGANGGGAGGTATYDTPVNGSLYGGGGAGVYIGEGGSGAKGKLKITYYTPSGDAVDTTALTTFVTKVGYTTPLIEAGVYLLHWSCELSNTTIDKFSRVRAQIDGSTVTGGGANLDIVSVFKAADDWHSLSGIKIITFGTETTHSIKFDYAAGDNAGANAGTAAIRNIRLYMLKLA